MQGVESARKNLRIVNYADDSLYQCVMAYTTMLMPIG